MKRMLVLLIVALGASVVAGASPATASHDSCSGYHCIAVGGSVEGASASAYGEWQNRRQQYITKLALCDKRAATYVQAYYMVRLRYWEGGRPEYIDVPAGDKLFKVASNDFTCVTVAEHWTIWSSEHYEQVASILKYREVDGLNEYGEVAAAGPWHYTNWDYNPYASCAECVPRP